MWGRKSWNGVLPTALVLLPGASLHPLCPASLCTHRECISVSSVTAPTADIAFWDCEQQQQRKYEKSTLFLWFIVSGCWIPALPSSHSPGFVVSCVSLDFQRKGINIVYLLSVYELSITCLSVCIYLSIYHFLSSMYHVYHLSPLKLF